MLEIGTKVACISTIALLILAIIISIIKLIKKDQKGFYKQFISLILIGLLTFLFIGNTSGGKNLKIEPMFFKEEKISSLNKQRTQHIHADTNCKYYYIIKWQK